VATDECAAALMQVFLRRFVEPEGSQALHDVECGGWVLGLLARGLGIELLGERRLRRGLEPLLDLARESLRALGRELAPPAAALPDVGRASDGGPTACWAVVRLLWHAARESDATPLGWSLAPAPSGEHLLRVETRASSALEQLAREAARALPGARFEPGDGVWTLRLPQGVFA
jgi:hypothetical protein